MTTNASEPTTHFQNAINEPADDDTIKYYWDAKAFLTSSLCHLLKFDWGRRQRLQFNCPSTPTSQVNVCQQATLIALGLGKYNNKSRLTVNAGRYGVD